MRALLAAMLLLVVAGPAVAETTTGGCRLYALSDLARQSDLIVVGRLFGEDEPPRWIVVDSVVKGRPAHRTIPIAVATSGEDCSGVEGRASAHKFYLKLQRGRGAPYKLLLAVPQP